MCANFIYFILMRQKNLKEFCGNQHHDVTITSLTEARLRKSERQLLIKKNELEAMRNPHTKRLFDADGQCFPGSKKVKEAGIIKPKLL